MIKIDSVILPSPEQMRFIIEGMRNPMNSWDRSDSYTTHIEDADTLNTADFVFFLGDNDEELMKRLCKAGTEHRKYMRMMPVMMRISAPIYWWKEMDTYKLGTVRNSTSTMHKLLSKPIVAEDFSIDDQMLFYIGDAIIECERLRLSYLATKNEMYWRGLIQLLPQGYIQTANMFFNYEILANIYKQRKNHKLKEWRDFCDLLKMLPYGFLITGGDDDDK